MDYFTFKVIHEFFLSFLVFLLCAFSLHGKIKKNKNAFIYSTLSVLFNLAMFANAPTDKISILYIHFNYFLASVTIVSLTIAITSYRKRFINELELKEKITYAVVTFFFISLGSSLFYSNPGKSNNKFLLSPPLKNGTFYIAQGGNTPLNNAHYLFKTQKYALDIVKICDKDNIYLNRYKSNNSFCIWNEPVFSVCNAIVSDQMDGRPENVALKQTDTIFPKGNYIELTCESGVKILYAHLLSGSIKTKLGQSVKSGVQIANVGNSGNSSEPHLHIQANLNSEPEVLYFNNKAYKRYDKINL